MADEPADSEVEILGAFSDANAPAGALMRHSTAVVDFTFHALGQRIAAISDGPTDHRRPKWMTPLQGVGAIGMIVGVTPSLLILKWEPAMWMATMARVGVLVSALGWAPQFFYDSFWIVRSLLKWRSEQARTLDHEFREFRRLQEWLGQFPLEVLAEHARFAAAAHRRLIAKLGFLAGGSDKLAVIPLIALIAVQAKVFQDFSSVPVWQVCVALFAAITYAIAVVGHLMWLRLGLYESILSEALLRRSKRGA
jgi:hypothetical protein